MEITKKAESVASMRYEQIGRSVTLGKPFSKLFDRTTKIVAYRIDGGINQQATESFMKEMKLDLKPPEILLPILMDYLQVQVPLRGKSAWIGGKPMVQQGIYRLEGEYGSKRFVPSEYALSELTPKDRESVIDIHRGPNPVLLTINADLIYGRFGLTSFATPDILASIVIGFRYGKLQPKEKVVDIGAARSRLGISLIRS
jgi:hypothetical protein